MSCAMTVSAASPTQQAIFTNMPIPGAPGYVSGINYHSYNSFGGSVAMSPSSGSSVAMPPSVGGSVALSPRFNVPTRGQRGPISLEPRLNDLLYGDTLQSTRQTLSNNVSVSSSHPSASLTLPLGTEIGNPMNASIGRRRSAGSSPVSSPAASSVAPPPICFQSRIHGANLRSLSPNAVRCAISGEQDLRRSATPIRAPTRTLYNVERRSLSPQRHVTVSGGANQQFLGIFRRVSKGPTPLPGATTTPVEPPRFLLSQGHTRPPPESPRRACSSPTKRRGSSDHFTTVRTTAVSPTSGRARSPLPVYAGCTSIGTGLVSIGSPGGSLNMPPPRQAPSRYPLSYSAQIQPRQMASYPRGAASVSVERSPVPGALSPVVREAKICQTSRSKALEAKRPLRVDTTSRAPAEGTEPRGEGGPIQSETGAVIQSEELSPKYVERPNPFLALLPKETRDVIDRITELLGDRDVLKTHVVLCFKKAVAGEGTDLCDDELDIRALHLFRDLLSEELRVPSQAFGDLEVEQIRFDFTGTGTLSLNEAYRLVKFHLRQYRKQLGGAPVTVDIPFRSLQLAGFTITKELGAGSQGTAKLATNQLGAQFCIKCYRKDKMNAGGVEELKEEFEALQLLHCNSIAGAFEMFQDAHSFYMVGEAFYGGDFMTLKQRARAQNVDMNEQWWRGVFKQCFEALAFMHKQAMIHCDIKEPNMMLKTSDFRQPQVVIIDLGVAKAMAASDEGIPHGTPGYVPPETWETKKWFPTGDVFSLGVVILQVITDKSPPSGPRSKDTPGGIFVEGCSNVREIFLATQTRPPPIHLVPKDLQDLADLCERCLEKRMEDRPRSVEALKLPFFCSSTRRKKSSVSELDLNPRNRFATVGITKQFLQKFSSMEEDANEEEDDDNDEDENVKQKKKSMQDTLFQIQEAARRSGHSIDPGCGESEDLLGEESSETLLQLEEPAGDSFQVSKKAKPSVDAAVKPALVPPISSPQDSKVRMVSTNRFQPSGAARSPLSPPHGQRIP